MAATAISSTIVVVLVGAAAFVSLDQAGRQGVLGKIAELSYQFVAIVLLGALLKKVIDDAQEQRREQAALMDRRVGVIRRLIDVSHEIELARVLVRANRSVKMWTKQMNERVITAHIEVRDIRHDERTATSAGTPVFVRWPEVLPQICTMEKYLWQLIDEFADAKKDLAELQLTAEADRSRQGEVWARLRELERLSDLMYDGAGYEEFRVAYGAALTILRAEVEGSSTASP